VITEGDVPFLEGTTLVLLEAPWTSRFSIQAEFLPESSVEPFLQAFTRNWKARLITRQLSTVDDFHYWCAATGKAHFGTTVLWLAAHGEQIREKPFQAGLSLPPVKKKNVRLTPEVVKTGLARCGGLLMAA